MPVGSDLPRSLSEQLRILEEQLNRLSGDASVQLSHPARDPMGLPTRLGRPIGLAPPVRAATLGVPDRHPSDEDADLPVMPRPSTWRRHAVIGGCSLLLLSATAIIPSVWHLTTQEAVPAATLPALPAVEVALRTEQFAARGLGQARFGTPMSAQSEAAAPALAISPPAALLAPGNAPETPPAIRESRTPTGPSTTTSPTTRLTVAESDLQRLSLPMLVSGGGPSWAGSAVIIDGLPTDARVSHGMKIAPDTWTVGIDDVGHAVLSLPPTTPDRLELSVRVLAANSRELAASALQIHVVRTSAIPAQITPAALFEPAAADAAHKPVMEPDPVSRQAVKVERPRRPASPVAPAKAPATQQAKQPEQPKATSAWVSTVQPSAPVFGLAPAPKWSPFSER
jgi:hypothetical protein